MLVSDLELRISDFAQRSGGENHQGRSEHSGPAGETFALAGAFISAVTVRLHFQENPAVAWYG